MSNKEMFKESAVNSEKITIGRKVRVNPMADLINQDNWRDGTVTFINKENGWFLVEFKSLRGNATMRKSYTFYDVGSKVRFSD